MCAMPWQALVQPSAPIILDAPFSSPDRHANFREANSSQLCLDVSRHRDEHQSPITMDPAREASRLQARIRLRDVKKQAAEMCNRHEISLALTRWLLRQGLQITAH